MRRIASIDIETFPQLGYFWSDNRPYNIIKRVEDTAMCCVTVKWLGGRQETFALPDFDGYTPGSRDDKALCERLWKILDDAEYVIAHNGDRFDVKKINARMIINGLPPYSPILTIDTLKEAKRIGGFDSNRLAYLGSVLGVGEKMDSGGAPLWFACLAGEPKAWRKMKRYCAQDGRVLEGIYYELRPWMRNHPSLASGFACPRCMSTEVTRGGYNRRRKSGLRTARYYCKACSSWCSDTVAVKEDVKPLVAA
jgi:hypothetical protein